MRVVNVNLGTQFANWTVCGEQFSDNGVLKIPCICVCGTERAVRCLDLINNKSKSCGCVKNIKKEDLKNKTFGRLTVVDYDCLKSSKNHWLCQCSCGNKNLISVSAGHLKTGHTKSCGCLRSEKLIDRSSSHKETHSRLHNIWSLMKGRCHNPKNKKFQQYGGRGVQVCAEWHSYENFRDWSLSNGYSEELSLERINVDGDYTPTNCCWIPIENQRFNKQSTVRIKIDDDCKSLIEWATIYNIDKNRVYSRLTRGWHVLDALTLDKGSKNPRQEKYYLIDGESINTQELIAYCVKNNIDYEQFISSKRYLINRSDDNSTRSVKVSLKDYYIIDGEKKTLGDWCDYYNVPKGRVKDRLNSGWDIVEALTAPKGQYSKAVKDSLKLVSQTSLEWNDQIKKLSDWCTELNVNRYLVYDRVRRGWNCLDALLTPKGYPNPSKKNI